MRKIINSNILKIIAIITMLIDHIGAFLYPNIIILRVIGRISFPIFSFCIAEGLYYTKSISKYCLRLTMFAIISQIPYVVLIGAFYKLNILFTFLVSIYLIVLLKNYLAKNKTIENYISLAVFFLSMIIVLVCEPLGIFDYGIFGVLITISFYFFREKLVFKNIVFVTLIIFMVVENIILLGFSFGTIIQLVSILDVILFIFYNGQRGNVKLKYFFYIFYPVHLALLIIIKILFI